MAEEKPSPRVEQMLGAMESWGASDLFLCGDKAPAVRLHGAVVPLDVPKTPASEIERFLAAALGEKKLADLKRSGDLDTGYSLPDGRRFRLNVARQLGRFSITARVLPTGALALENLGLPDVMRSWAERTRGLIVLAGGTGSGKSTTLAAMLHHINTTRAAHIVTIEEPVEFLHSEIRSRITQREVGADTASVEVALRQALRESPDVIAIGELHSREAVELALQAAQTGQLVIAAVTSTDVAHTLQRLAALFPDAQAAQIAHDLSVALIGIAAQRLVPRSDNAGRIVVVERLQASAPASKLIRDRRTHDLEDMLRRTSDAGNCSFDRALLDLERAGRVSLETALAHASNPAELALAARRGAPAGDSSMATNAENRADDLSIERLLARVEELGASDLHLAVGEPPILRISGELASEETAPLVPEEMRLLLHSIMSVRQRLRYEEERELDFSLGLRGGRRFRVNAYYERDHMAAAIRAIPSKIPTAESLGLPPALLKMGAQPHGLLLVVGPTGAGKTTTLACLVDRINRARACHVLTIEDPIEYVHTSQKAMIHQREVGPDTHGFSIALRHVLRQDPDVILIGELRDLETISAAITAAETGHLVLATLHTNDAIQTIDRIVDVFPPHQQPQVRSQLASALLGIVSQRLLPRADGKGRVGAFELLVGSPAIRALIREGKMHQALGLMQAGKSLGMMTMDSSIEDLVNKRVVDRNEAMRHMLNPAVLASPAAQTAAAGSTVTAADKTRPR